MHYRSRDGAEPYFTVLHYSAGRGELDALRQGLEFRGLSAHWGVARDGAVENFVSTDFLAYHAGDHTRDWKGGSRFPTLRQLLDALQGSLFVPLSAVPYQKLFVNAHSDGIEVCNVGYGKGGKSYVSAPHENPGCRRMQWESFSYAQYNAIHPLLRFRFITDHSSLVNRHTLGKVGGKVDIGPAFDYSHFTGFVRVRFDYKRVGWQLIVI